MLALCLSNGREGSRLGARRLTIPGLLPSNFGSLDTCRPLALYRSFSLNKRPTFPSFPAERLRLALSSASSDSWLSAYQIPLARFSAGLNCSMLPWIVSNVHVQSTKRVEIADRYLYKGLYKRRVIKILLRQPVISVFDVFGHWGQFLHCR